MQCFGVGERIYRQKTIKKMIETDIDLIAGLRKQSPKAQQQMLDRYGRDVFAQVARLVPGIENAEEVYQDVFVKVFKNINRYDEGKSALRTWILRIAYNEAISFLRHQRPTMVYIEDREGEADSLSETEVEETLGHANAETKQNQAFTEMFKVRGSLPPKTKRAQKYVNSLTEKYMKELSTYVYLQ